MLKSYLEVDLNKISNNIEKIQNYVGNKVNVAPVIKADAYGLGANKLKNILEKNNINIVVVATVEEAINLRKEGFKCKILTLNELLPYEAKEVVEYDLTPGISDLEVAKKLDKIAKNTNKKVSVHIEVDTGMGRVGLAPDMILEFVQNISKLENIELEGIYTHFASADTNETYTAMQIEKFNTVLELLKENGFNFKYIHSSASSGIINYPNAKFNMVRPGIITYGYMPDKSIINSLNLKPCTKLISHIVFIKEVQKGTAISYGGTYIAPDKRKIATIPLGYADGIRRALSNNGRVYINGKYAPIVGRICMDNFMVDVTDIDVKVGDRVVIWDNENITLEEIADRCDTINYEILCMISKRVKRKYIEI